jgi:hypothetical protein
VWSDDGTSFEILDLTRFVQEILPIVFRHQNYPSFVRQLNKYSFSKIRASHGNDNPVVSVVAFESVLLVSCILIVSLF